MLTFRAQLEARQKELTAALEQKIAELQKAAEREVAPFRAALGEVERMLVLVPEEESPSAE